MTPDFIRPNFDCWKIIYTAIGVSAFWAKWGRKKLRPYVLPEVVGLIGNNENARAVVEFAIFLVLGIMVGIGVGDPHGVVQALTAGFGWTGVFSHHTKA
jgi:hypothetical protein